MTKIRDVLRLKEQAKLTNRDISHCLKIGAATVSDILARFNQAQLTWSLPDELDDAAQAAKLYPCFFGVVIYCLARSHCIECNLA